MHGLPLTCLLLLSGLASCVKPPDEDPVPVLEYDSVQSMARYTSSTQAPRDSAVLVLKYADGDGDIFRDNNSDGPNFVSTTYAFNPDSNKFVIDQGPNPQTITQPANGYYKGKAIHGEMFIPMRNFRSSTDIKIVKFEAFVVDMKGNKSNVVASPVFTLTF